MTDTSEKISWLDKLRQALHREPQDKSQLLAVLRDAEQRDLLQPDSLLMIEGVMQISEMQVRDIMIPRSQMTVLDEEDELSIILEKITPSRHSRFPVIADNKDEVIGILHAKDLLPFHEDPDKKFDVSDIVRPAVYVPESKRLDVLLKEFRRNRNHLAIVVDEYGGVSGMVTIEDVIEQIVGDIEDEFDIEEEAFIKPITHSEYTIKALTPIEEFNEYFHTHWSKDEFDTVGGLILQRFGHMPKRGESLDIGPYHFEILSADQRRIGLLRMTIIE